MSEHIDNAPPREEAMMSFYLMGVRDEEASREYPQNHDFWDSRCDSGTLESEYRRGRKAVQDKRHSPLKLPIDRSALINRAIECDGECAAGNPSNPRLVDMAFAATLKIEDVKNMETDDAVRVRSIVANAMKEYADLVVAKASESGVASEPWESVKRRLFQLVKPLFADGVAAALAACEQQLPTYDKSADEAIRGCISAINAIKEPT